MAKTADSAVHIALTEAPDAGQGVSLMQRAQGIVIRDKASHEQCREFLKGAKALKRSIEEHYAAIKKPLNAARANVLDMEKRDLAPVESAIAIADKYDTAYVNEQRRIELEAENERRRQEEARILKQREQEAAKAEAEALKLEASSDALSDREQAVVVYVASRNVNDPNVWLVAVRMAGYKDAERQASRLMGLQKLGAAVENAIKAKRLRAESQAKQAAPVIVEVETAPSEVVDGGFRRYYGCGEVDVLELAKAVVAGTVHVLALSPNLPYLNTQAKALKELFPKAYPGCQLSRRDGTVSR